MAQIWPLTSQPTSMRAYQWLPLFFLLACTSTKTAQMQQSPQKIDIQGHRGCRGLLPENSIPAFIKAVDLGVTTLELDVVVSRDRELVVSHEPWLSSTICTGPDGQAITMADSKKYNLYLMDYAQIARCDCGSKGNPGYPEQQKMKVTKPRLAEVIDAVEQHLDASKLPRPNYNIEIKSVPSEYNVFQPEPEVFVELVYQLLKQKKMLKRANVQSFDPKVLQVLHQRHPEVVLSYLEESPIPAAKALEELGFVPQIYSPFYKFVNAEMIAYAASQKMKVIPWTINNYDDMLALKKLGVDGIITDYPDRALKLWEEK
jgi:glycerophosphoryl diester phosphodiesterase